MQADTIWIRRLQMTGSEGGPLQGHTFAAKDLFDLISKENGEAAATPIGENDNPQA